MNDRGSVAPLIAGFLSLILAAGLMAISSLTVLVTSQRLQGLVDAAVIFAHDQSHSRGNPIASQLDKKVQEFLAQAPSAKSLQITRVKSWIEGSASGVEICARWQDPLLVQILLAREICRTAKAKSFVVF